MDKNECYKIYNKALRNGSLEKGPCIICGKIRVHGHHEDYNKPLNIICLCGYHHRNFHSLIKKCNFDETIQILKERYYSGKDRIHYKTRYKQIRIIEGIENGRILITAQDLSHRWCNSLTTRTLANWRVQDIGPKYSKIGNKVLYDLQNVENFEKEGKQ